MVGGMPQSGQQSWLLNLLAAQQGLGPGMLPMGSSGVAPQGYQGDKFGGIQQSGMFPGLPSQAALLIQQLQQAQNAGVSCFQKYCQAIAAFQKVGMPELFDKSRL